MLREAGIQKLLAEGAVIPFTVAYEDLERDQKGTLRRLLRFLDLPNAHAMTFLEDRLERLADDVSEAWVQRFRREKQEGWCNTGW